MARSQGDGYRTWTDVKLNAYKARLNAKLGKLRNHKEKWYYTGCGWILAEECDDDSLKVNLTYSIKAVHIREI